MCQIRIYCTVFWSIRSTLSSGNVPKETSSCIGNMLDVLSNKAGTIVFYAVWQVKCHLSTIIIGGIDYISVHVIIYSTGGFHYQQQKWYLRGTICIDWGQKGEVQFALTEGRKDGEQVFVIWEISSIFFIQADFFSLVSYHVTKYISVLYWAIKMSYMIPRYWLRNSKIRNGK